jgi:hypothetical protein
MVVEIAICSVSLIGTAALIVSVVRAAKHRFWLRCVAALLAVVAIHVIAFNLVGPDMRAYVYVTNIPDFRPYECPCKGIPYEHALATYEQRAALDNTVHMFRTFRKGWWNFYRWHDYATHPRWHWSYRPREVKEMTNEGLEATR